MSLFGPKIHLYDNRENRGIPLTIQIRLLPSLTSLRGNVETKSIVDRAPM